MLGRTAWVSRPCLISSRVLIVAVVAAISSRAASDRCASLPLPYLPGCFGGQPAQGFRSCYRVAKDAKGTTVVQCAYGSKKNDAVRRCKNGQWAPGNIEFCEAAPRSAWRIVTDVNTLRGWWLHDLQFYEDSSCRVPLPPGTVRLEFASGPNGPDQEPPRDAFDGDVTNWWRAPCGDVSLQGSGCPAGRASIGVHFGSAKEVGCVRMFQFDTAQLTTSAVRLETWSQGGWQFVKRFSGLTGGSWQTLYVKSTCPVYQLPNYASRWTRIVTANSAAAGDGAILMVQCVDGTQQTQVKCMNGQWSALPLISCFAPSIPLLPSRQRLSTAAKRDEGLDPNVELALWLGGCAAAVVAALASMHLGRIWMQRQAWKDLVKHGAKPPETDPPPRPVVPKLALGALNLPVAQGAVNYDMKMLPAHSAGKQHFQQYAMPSTVPKKAALPTTVPGSGRQQGRGPPVTHGPSGAHGGVRAGESPLPSTRSTARGPSSYRGPAAAVPSGRGQAADPSASARGLSSGRSASADPASRAAAAPSSSRGQFPSARAASSGPGGAPDSSRKLPAPWSGTPDNPVVEMPSSSRGQIPSARNSSGPGGAPNSSRKLPAPWSGSPDNPVIDMPSSSRGQFPSARNTSNDPSSRSAAVLSSSRSQSVGAAQSSSQGRFPSARTNSMDSSRKAVPEPSSNVAGMPFRQTAEQWSPESKAKQAVMPSRQDSAREQASRTTSSSWGQPEHFAAALPSQGRNIIETGFPKASALGQAVQHQAGHAVGDAMPHKASLFGQAMQQQAPGLGKAAPPVPPPGRLPTDGGTGGLRHAASSPSTQLHHSPMPMGSSPPQASNLTQTPNRRSVQEFGASSPSSPSRRTIGPPPATPPPQRHSPSPGQGIGQTPGSGRMQAGPPPTGPPPGRRGPEGSPASQASPDIAMRPTQGGWRSGGRR